MTWTRSGAALDLGTPPSGAIVTAYAGARGCTPPVNHPPRLQTQTVCKRTGRQRGNGTQRELFGGPYSVIAKREVSL